MSGAGAPNNYLDPKESPTQKTRNRAKLNTAAVSRKEHSAEESNRVGTANDHGS